MADGRVFSALSQFDIPSSKKLRRTKSASDLSVMMVLLAFNSPICDIHLNRQLPSYQKGVEQQHEVSIKINGKDIESLSVQARKAELGKRNLPFSGEKTSFARICY